MHEDHVGTREIEAAILVTIDDERSVVQDELEAETADGTAGIACARCVGAPGPWFSRGRRIG